MRKSKIRIISISFFLLFLGFFAYYFYQKLTPEPKQDYSLTLEETSEETPENVPQLEGEEVGYEEEKETEESAEAPLPLKINNQAPFIPQAPFANWDQLHDEACEEAALIIAHYYSLGIKKITKEEGEKEILAMVKFQEEKYGSHTDLNAQKIVALAADFYGDNYQIVTECSLKNLKEILAQGSIIIAPMAGRVLENPYFKQPGPLYHALIITGYNEKKQHFITNDPGTKRGEGFEYSYKNLLESIHDFPGEKEKILTGEKVVIKVRQK